MNILFREFDSFNLWIWFEFDFVPSEMEKQYLEELLVPGFSSVNWGASMPKTSRFRRLD